MTYRWNILKTAVRVNDVKKAMVMTSEVFIIKNIDLGNWSLRNNEKTE
jgi:hypothetical protein